jgi:hypothetical protein
MDPYVVTRLIVDTVCSAAEAKGGKSRASTNGASKAKVPAKKKVAARR